MKLVKNQRGQSLIEYVILVALIGVATMGMVRLLQDTVKVSLANVIGSLGTHNFTHRRSSAITDQDLRRSDFSNFMENTHSRGGNHD